MKNKNLPDSGFSIVEIMVAMGLLGVLSYGVMKLMDNANKVSKDIQTKDEIFQFQNEINQILSNPTNCQENLYLSKLRDNPMKTGIRLFRNGESVSVHQVGQNSSTSRDVLVKPTISEATIKKVELIEPDGSNALVDLEIKFRKPDNINRIGGEEVSRILKISASLCPRSFLNNNSCSAGQRQIDSGGTTAAPWVVCEDCNADLNGNPITPASPIMSCYALGFGSVPTISSTAPASNQQNSDICEFKKLVFFQSKRVGARLTIDECNKTYEIILKRQIFTKDTPGQITIPPQWGTTFYSTNDSPNYSNIITNSLVLHLLGAGGGGGCGGDGGTGAATWGHGGYVGDKKAIPLETVNAGVGDAMTITVGKGGIGGGGNGVPGYADCKYTAEYLARNGGTTTVVIYNTTNTTVQTTLIAKGGAGGENQIETGIEINSLTGDYGCTGEPSGFFVTSNLNFSGGSCNKNTKKTPGTGGGIGSGGGGGYNEDGGQGGDGAVALTWLEWKEVP